MKLYGLMITKDDEAIFGNWCREQLPLYDAVVCLDGSTVDATARLAADYADRLIYLHERDYPVEHKTDHGLRAVVHGEIVRRFGSDHWVMCCHADEFCYHDPRKVAVRAAREGFDSVGWLSLQFYPHPEERAVWGEQPPRPIGARSRYYHWSYRGDGYPWLEDRLYRNGPHVSWDGKTHGNTKPLGLSRRASFYPTLRHYKVFTASPDWYQGNGAATHYRHHWEGAPQRTGLPFQTHQEEDFFVTSVRDYARCDRFDGTLPHPWNLGDCYRPETAEELKALR